MAKVKVVRVEHRSEICNKSNHYEGVYFNRWERYSEETCSRMEGMRTPRNWFNPAYEKVFAFRDVDSMLRHFTTEMRREFSKRGFVISLYEIEDTYIEWDEEGVQCAFIAKAAALVRRVVATHTKTIIKLAA